MSPVAPFRRPARTLRPGRTARTAAGAGVAAVAVSLAGLTATADAATAGRELHLTFDSVRQQSGNSGASALTVRTVTRNGGSVASTTGPDGGAIRLPAYRASNPPMAALAVTDQQGTDDLAPGTARLRFGADFAIDSTSQGSSADNGNNLVQRGLFNHPMQYKLEVDGNRPLCRVKGGAGAVQVRSSMAVTPGVWYRAVCERSGSTVTLKVVRLDNGNRWVYSRSGATGALRPSSRSVPLAVGGKLDGRGSLTRSADQFNGRVDNVFVNIG